MYNNLINVLKTSHLDLYICIMDLLIDILSELCSQILMYSFIKISFIVELLNNFFGDLSGILKHIMK